MDDGGVSEERALRLEAMEVMELEALRSTERALAKLYEADGHAVATTQMLAVQDEQLDVIVGRLDGVRNDVAHSDAVLRRIASPLAFLYVRKREAFETRFGAPPDWSGMLRKRRTMLPTYSKRYCAILGDVLLCFQATDAPGLDAASLGKPKGEFKLLGAQLSSDRSRLELTLCAKQGGAKWHLRCEDEKDFVGWTAMLEKHSKGRNLKAAVARKPARSEVADTGASGEAVRAALTATATATATPMPVTAAAPVNRSEMDTDSRIDANLDDMMRVLDNLTHMALEQKQAIDVQNEKLDVVDEGIGATDNDLTVLKRKHKRRLR